MLTDPQGGHKQILTSFRKHLSVSESISQCGFYSIMELYTASGNVYSIMGQHNVGDIQHNAGDIQHAGDVCWWFKP